MSKFCENCGFELEDDAIFCVNCGASVNEEPSGEYKGKGPEMFNQEPAASTQGQKIGKIIKGVVIAAIVIAAVAIVANIVVKSTGHKGFLRKVMKAYENYDIDRMASLASDIYYYDDEEYTQAYFERAVGESHDYFDQRVGDNHKFSYKIEDSFALTGRKESLLFDQIKRMYPDFDEDSIKKVVVAEVKITAKKDKRSVSRKIKITMSKEGSKWKLLFID